MKIKYVLKSKTDFQKWVTIGNAFAKSLCPKNEVLKQGPVKIYAQNCLQAPAE